MPDNTPCGGFNPARPCTVAQPTTEKDVSVPTAAAQRPAAVSYTHLYDALEAEPKTGVTVACGALSSGMEYPAIHLAVLTEGQILAQRRSERRAKPKTARNRIQSYADLHPGDLIVHDLHGIGRFVGCLLYTSIAEFDIMYGLGINYFGELVDLGITIGEVEKSGSWFALANGERMGQGRDKAIQYLRDNPEIADALAQKIREKSTAVKPAEQAKLTPMRPTPQIDIGADDFDLPE